MHQKQNINLLRVPQGRVGCMVGTPIAAPDNACKWFSTCLLAEAFVARYARSCIFLHKHNIHHGNKRYISWSYICHCSRCSDGVRLLHVRIDTFDYRDNSLLSDSSGTVHSSICGWKVELVALAFQFGHFHSDSRQQLLP
jgi:hypothetical protein